MIQPYLFYKKHLFKFLCSCILVFSCQKKETPKDPVVTDPPAVPPVATPTIRGYSLSPQGFPLDYNAINSFFQETKEFERTSLMWNGAWRDDSTNGSDAGTTPLAASLLQQNAATYAYTPITVFGWRSGTTLYIKLPANSTNNWSNTNAQSAFSNMLSSFVSNHHPSYIFLGNENDFYYEQDATDYQRWIAAYNSFYDTIKAASPNTLVGPVFNVEHLAGTGGFSGWTTPNWPAIDSHDFSKVDVVGLTLYPWLQYTAATLVPSNYLDSVITHINDKPIAITETGWPAENLGSLNPTWETSEMAQQTYMSSLKAMLTGKNVKFINWLFLYGMVDPGGSPNEWKLFGSVSLKSSTGATRAGHDDWLNFSL